MIYFTIQSEVQEGDNTAQLPSELTGTTTTY